MAIKYYPLSRVKTNLNTRGGTYLLNGKPYVGSYYLTYKGEAYTGINPAVGGNELLTPAPPPSAAGQRFTGKYGAIAKTTAPGTGETFTPAIIYADGSTGTLQALLPSTPVLTEIDYARGYFTRYFAKRIADKGYIFEILQSDWARAQNAEDAFYEEYEYVDMLWKLTGPLTDKRVSQYQVIGGVETTNKRVTEAKAKSFIGLIEYIGGDYTKFARITP